MMTPVRPMLTRPVRWAPRVLGLGLCLGLAVPAQGQTCTFPWTADHDPSVRFQVGRAYRSPYAEVIQVLARVCVAYDVTTDDNGQPISKTCGVWALAARNVQGQYLRNRATKAVVYTLGDTLAYASGTLPETQMVGSWGLVPEGCVPPVTVIQLEAGAVTIQTR